MRFIRVSAVCFLSAWPVAAAEPDPVVAEKLAAGTRVAWNLPGLAVVVVRGDETLLLKGYGVRSLGTRDLVTEDTLFPLASCTKAFTTTLIAMLADDGTIGWDDPVRKHFAGFKLSDPHADALLTIRDLLCHRTGINGHDLLWYRAPWDIDETLKRAAKLPLEYPFRGGYRYSSIPYLAAGRIIEGPTKEKWQKLVRSRICEPLGMTGVRLASDGIPNDADRAGGHRLSKPGEIEPMPAYEIREANPAGSVFATPNDLAKWLKFHLADGVGPDGTRLVSVKNLVETRTPQNLIRMEGMLKSLNPDTVQVSYAMGWLVYDHRGKKVVSHGGMIDGFRVQITMLPDENLGFAVLTNLHDTRANAALTNSLIDHYCGLRSKDWNAYFKKIVAHETAEKNAATEAREKARDPNSKPTFELVGYAGEYVHPAYGSARVAFERGKLVLKWSSFTVRLEHYERDAFRVADGFFDDQLVPFTVAGKKVKTLKFAGQEFEKK